MILTKEEEDMLNQCDDVIVKKEISQNDLIVYRNTTEKLTYLNEKIKKYNEILRNIKKKLYINISIYIFNRSEIESNLNKFEDEGSKNIVNKIKDKISNRMSFLEIEGYNNEIESAYKQYINNAQQYKEELNIKITDYIKKYPNCNITLDDNYKSNAVFNEIEYLKNRKCDIEVYIIYYLNTIRNQ